MQKLKSKNFSELKDALKSISYLVKKEKLAYSTILFSPCAASFDNFKNFEKRGEYFNKIIKKYINA